MPIRPVRQSLSRTGVSGQTDVVPYLQRESHTTLESVRRTLNALIAQASGESGSGEVVLVDEQGAQHDGSFDDTEAIIQAVGLAAESKRRVHFGRGTYRVTRTIDFPTEMRFSGVGAEAGTTIDCVGSGFGFGYDSPGTRGFYVQFSDMRINFDDPDGGGIDLTDISHSDLRNLAVFGPGQGSGTCIQYPGTANGRALYNRAWNVRCLSARHGFSVGGPGSNDATFIACRTAACEVGLGIHNSNHVMAIACEFESGLIGIEIESDAGPFGTGALADHLTVIGCRFEGNDTANIALSGTSAFVRHLIRVCNAHITGTPQTGTAGIGFSIIGDTGTATSAVHMLSAQVDRPYVFERTSNSDDPAFEVVHSASGSGVPSGIRSRMERAGGHAFSVFRTADGGETAFWRADGHLEAESIEVREQFTLSSDNPTAQIGSAAGLARVQYNKDDAVNNSFAILASGGTASANFDWALQHQISGNVAYIRFNGTSGAVVDTPMRMEFANGEVGFANQIQHSLDTGVTAAGANQAAATLLLRDVNTITGGAAGTGVRLAPAISSGSKVTIVANRSGSSKELYPASGDNFTGSATNASVAIADGATVQVANLDAAEYGITTW